MTNTTEKAIVSFNIKGDSFVTVQQKDAIFVLNWTDGVVNEWSESYPTLSVALARAAVLAACGEAEWEKGFVNSPAEFADNAEAFLSKEAF